MHIEYATRWLVAIGCLVSGLVMNGGAQQPETESRRLLHASEAEQTAWLRQHIDKGIPASEAFGTLALNRSQLTLPLVEAKIVQVLRSPTPSQCFTDPSVNPQKFVDYAAEVIAENGDMQALIELRKLLNIDEQRFGRFIQSALMSAESYRNPFEVAYRGLELGDKRLEARIMSWAELKLADKRPPRRNFGPQTPVSVSEMEKARVRAMWAQALAGRLARVPTEADWHSDPIASRLDPDHAHAVHDDVMRYAAQAALNRPKP